MPLIRETRQSWGARPPKFRRYVPAAVAATGGVAVHWPGITGSMRGISHDQCHAFLRGWQAMHMAGNSNDLEYGSVICTHRRWMEGRTEFDNWLVRVGSNGTTASNDNFTSIQFMLGTDDIITNEEIDWLAEAIATERKHGWGSRVVGHRYFVGTDCPGDSIMRALPEITRRADEWGEEPMRLSDEDIDKIAEETAARVNRVLGDFNSKGKPIGPNKDNPQLGAVYIRQIKNLSRKILGEVQEEENS